MAGIMENRMLLTNCVAGVVTGLERTGSNPTVVLDPAFLSQCAFSAHGETYPFPPGEHATDCMPQVGQRAGRSAVIAGISPLARRGMQIGLGSLADIWSMRRDRGSLSGLCPSTKEDKAKVICIGLKTTTPKA